MTHPRIGVCSWSLRPADPRALVDALQRLDVSSCQLALGPLLNDPDVWGGAIEFLRASSIRIASGMMATRGEDYTTPQTIAATGGVRPDATWPENLRAAEATAQLAADAGIGLVTFHAGFIPETSGDAVRVSMLERLRCVADLFAARGVDVALETGQETGSTLLAAMDELDRPAVGVNFDPANMLLYGMGDPVESLRLLRGRVRQVHIKDALPSPQPGVWGREVPVGEGAVDWPGFFAECAGIEPPVDCIIEREAGADREPEIIRARDLIRTNLPDR